MLVRSILLLVVVGTGLSCPTPVELSAGTARNSPFVMQLGVVYTGSGGTLSHAVTQPDEIVYRA